MSNDSVPHYPLSPDAFLSGLDLMLEVRAAARRAGRLTDPDGPYNMRAATAAAEALLAAIGVSISTDPAPGAAMHLSAATVEHTTKTTLTSGGIVDVRCTCGWHVTAPTTRSAEKAAGGHRGGVR